MKEKIFGPQTIPTIPTEHDSASPLASTSIKSAGITRAEVLLPTGAREVSERLITSERSCKVAIAQIATDPGRIAENTAKIISYIERAKEKGAEIVVFPELTIPGYASMDLLFNEEYIVENVLALEKIKKATDGITAIVGFANPDFSKSRPGGRPYLYNSAAVLRNGETLNIQDKELLPTYNIFFEERYFESGKKRNVIEAGGIKIGTEICEDLWSGPYASNPTKELAEKGADLVINLSASPFSLGKLGTRTDLIQAATKSTGVPFVYTNLVGAYDGYEGEVVFDGRSIVMGADGQLKALGKSFEEDLVVVDVFGKQELAIPEIQEVEELHDALVLGIKDYFRRIGSVANFKKAIIGISGGIDSAVVAALAVTALGRDNVLGITMPSQYSSSETRSDAEILAHNLGIAFKTAPIQQEYTSVLQQMRADPEIAALPENVAEENIQARLRMVNLMYYANKLGGLVLNTGNKTELAIDNCTIYGDMVGGFSVLGDVDKDRVYDLARYINQRAAQEIIPVATIDRIPSAELKDNQSDATVMGGDPRTIAPAIREIVEHSLTYKQALQRFGDTYSPELLQRWFKRLDSSEWKRRQASPAIRVTQLAFGNGRRMPMSHGFYK